MTQNSRPFVIYIIPLLMIIAGGCSGILGGSGKVANTPLPPEVCGIWRVADEPAIEICLSPNGEVLSAVIKPGEVRVVPNKITKVENLDGSFSTYDVGPCNVIYKPEIRELTVSIIVRHLRVPFPTDVIEGKVEHAFIGKVSEDGSTWETTWMEFFDYGPRFPMDTEAVGEPVRFIKIQPSQNGPKH